MESNKQEKHDLLHDNPVAKDASGGRDGSWMSKHATQSRMSGGSPLHAADDEGTHDTDESFAAAVAKESREKTTDPFVVESKSGGPR